MVAEGFAGVKHALNVDIDGRDGMLPSEAKDESMKPTATQLANLKRLAKEGDLAIRMWGTGFGLRRPTVKTLADLGLVQYDPSIKTHIACGMTTAGYDLLKSTEGSPAKEHKLTDMDRQVLLALYGLRTNTKADETSSYAVARAAGLRTSSISETSARHLIRLVNAGLAERRGRRDRPHWCLTAEGVSMAETLTQV